MSAKSRNSAKAKGLPKAKRPIEAKVSAEARAVAEQYQVILAEESGRWHGRGLELPNVYGEGPSPEACIRDTRKAFALAVAYLIEHGRRYPAPAREGTRTQQVNVRLTAEEKALLETTAQTKGYKSLSDFIRAAAVNAAG